MTLPITASSAGRRFGPKHAIYRFQLSNNAVELTSIEIQSAQHPRRTPPNVAQPDVRP
ncbi:hypothetical protein XACLG98_2120001 [Xanthomonas citri pv. citri]|nr:hypothetical protein XACLG98_2120001 [Xanthomonas citri pv. citri]